MGVPEIAEGMRPKSKATVDLGAAGRLRPYRLLRYVRNNPELAVGILLLAGLLLFWMVGTLVYGTATAEPLSVRPSQPPGAVYPFGTDRQGRDLLAVMIAGTPLTLKIGIIAGIIGVGVGTILAFFAGYYGGLADAVIRGGVDVGLTIPSLLLLVVIAVSARGGLSVNQMALVVASTAWLWPARKIRSQVLSLRERAYVDVARLSGESGPRIIVTELMPNMLPYILTSLIDSISQAILASIGLEALGLGPMNSPTLGMTVYWAIYYSALLHGMWWWWLPPIIIIVVLFVGLFLVSIGLDQIANPRLRRTA